MAKSRGDRQAFGRPGIEPRWTHGSRDGVGTAMPLPAGSGSPCGMARSRRSTIPSGTDPSFGIFSTSSLMGNTASES